MFTAGLGAKGLAAAEVAELRPIGQVTGACVLRTQGYGSAQALGVARRRALGRLEQDARKHAADVVACVKVACTEQVAGETAQRDGVVLEAVSTGIAMALPGRSSPLTEPVLTNMTIGECWKLARGGYAPAGLVMSIIADAGSFTGAPTRSGGSVAGTNYEFADISAMFRGAYRRAASDMREQAAALGAEGVIAAQLDRRVTWAGLYVRIILTMMGTAVVSVADDRPTAPDAGRPRLRITPVRHVADARSPGI